MINQHCAATPSGWLLGDGAQTRVALLADSFFKSALNEANRSASEQFADYEPWMSGGFTALDWPKVDSLGTGCPKVLAPCEVDKVKAAMASGLKIGLEEEASTIALSPEMLSNHPEAARMFDDAWKNIVQTQSVLADLMQILIRQVIPLKSSRLGIQSGSSSSTHGALGAIFVALPRATCPVPVHDLSISIAHELGHQVLMLYQRSDRLIATDLNLPSYSGTRQTARPAIMALHAAVALAFMAECAGLLGTMVETSPSGKAYLARQQSENKQALRATLHGLKSHCFTKFGVLIFEELKTLAG